MNLTIYYVRFGDYDNTFSSLNEAKEFAKMYGIPKVRDTDGEEYYL